jgi:hypothetical protein
MSKKLAAAVELGRRGGKARARKLSPARRQEIGREGAKARWQNRAETAADGVTPEEKEGATLSR